MTLDPKQQTRPVEPATARDRVMERVAKYEPSDRVKAQIARSFVYHAPKDDQQERYVAIRAMGHALADLVSRVTPESREQSLALTKLEEAVMFANAAIARNE